MVLNPYLPFNIVFLWDLITSSSPDLLITIIILLMLPLFYFYSTRNHHYWRKRGIPGPPPLPLIGNFFSLNKPITLLYGEYVKQYGKICGIFQGQTPALLVTEPVVIKRILVQDFHLFRNRVPFGQEPRTQTTSNLIDVRDEQWKRIRSIVTPLFTTVKLRKMESQMNQCTEAMLNTLERIAIQQQQSSNGGKFIAHNEMGNFTMDVIGKCAFATETNASENNVFVQNARKLLAVNLIPFCLSQILPLWVFKLFRKLPSFRKEGSLFFIQLAHHLLVKRKTEQAKGVKSPEDLFQLMINAQHQEKDVKQNKKNVNSNDNDVMKVIETQEDLFEAHHDINISKCFKYIYI